MGGIEFLLIYTLNLVDPPSGKGLLLTSHQDETHISLSRSKIQIQDTLTFTKSDYIANEKNSNIVATKVIEEIEHGDDNEDDLVDEDDTVESYLSNTNNNKSNETKIYTAELTNRTNAVLKEVSKGELSNDTSICSAAGDILGEKCKDITLVQNQTAPTVKSDSNLGFPWFDKKWSFNATAADELRTQLEESCHTRELFLTTKQNVKQNSTLQYEGEPRKRLLITSQVHNILPKEMPFVNKTLKKCSVVGSSGILLGSMCGQQIDDSDFVVRLNLPGVYNYRKDVGSRTDLVSCNPTILKSTYSGLQTREARQSFIEALKEYGNASIYLPAFAFKTCTESSFRAYTTLRSTTREVVFAHPTHMWLVRKFWNDQGVGAVRISSGLLLFTIAMGLCDEVHLYGFWPFQEDMHGRPVYYHYFNENAYMLNKKKKKMHWHEMPSEFKQLQDLHMKGAIHVH
uniref:Alpha-N-acetylneuraminide alpha-2,8-sialyltransferase-like n=1 Tax=Saccoglossus kowalevskii TaxID=10224 RepID=A0ABM0GUJ6_SACKO